MSNRRNQKKGVASMFLLILMVPLLGLLAFSVDYGFLLYLKTDMQRTADQAVVAAARDLTPDRFGNQDTNKVRSTVRSFVQLNLGSEFTVNDDDIEIGRYSPNTIYGDVQLLNTGTLDTVRVILRRSDLTNRSVSLFFARLFGSDKANVSVTSTAVLQRGRFLAPGTQVFPFAIQQRAWNRLDVGDVVSIYGDGRIEDEYGDRIPGNWGTIDIGPSSNSTNALSNQIRDGLTQNDIDALFSQSRISDASKIDGSTTISLNGDTGLSAGLKHAVRDETGQMKIAPVYKKTSGHGGGLEYEIVSWVTVEIVGSSWNGSRNSNIEVRKAYTYDGSLLPVTDLSDTNNSIEGAYTSPALIE